MQRMMTSRSRLDVVIPTKKDWTSLQWFVNNNFGSHAAEMGEQRKISVKTLPQSHAMYKKPTIKIVLLKLTVVNTR